ncbi:5-methyltetrahydrofolate--homocysteine methyltransferase [Parelusimicrobium proximum]|uniref:endonuclease domain-containing protein n=1 Tax=Parelusimicrobium proximum TaxID=3228953 RepID=UPI003D164ADE
MQKNINSFARANRANLTPQENKLWNILKDKSMKYKFRRQYVVGNYIADFICLKKKLIIECDGGQHNEETDKKRDIYLKDQGYTVLRIWNKDIDRNIKGVYEIIRISLEKQPY